MAESRRLYKRIAEVVPPWTLAITGAAAVTAVLLPWQSFIDAVGRLPWPMVAMVVLGAGCLAAALAIPRQHAVTYPGVGSVGTISPTWVIVAGLFVVVTAWITTQWLLVEASAVQPPSEQAKSRIEAIRGGLTAAAGAGAAAALLLAFRRQRHQEAVAAGTEYDATEKRITELYVKAGDQLGSDRATVRLAGLYALERLAQDNHGHRQVVVDLLCAYLRMPAEDIAVEEREVRRTAQRLLTRHLRPYDIGDDHRRQPSPLFWPETDIDLSGAMLLDWNFHGCVVRQAVFVGAVFEGGAYFGEATFHNYAVFGGSRFEEDAWFVSTSFLGDAWFVEATFEAAASFQRAEFRRRADFNVVHFGGKTSFEGARFTTKVLMQGAGAQNGAALHLPQGWTAQRTDGSGWRIIESRSEDL